MTDQTPPPTAGGNAAAGLVADLLQPFKDEATATRLVIENRSAAQRITNMWLVGFVAVTTVLVVLVLGILVQNRQTSSKTREVIKNNAQLSATIADCTQVGGGCYEQSQTRLRAVIAQLIESNKAIAQCARQAGSDAQLDACVQDRLKTVTPATR